MSSCKNVSANMQTQIIIAARYIFSTHSWVTISQTYVCATIFSAVSKHILDTLTNTALQWWRCFESGFFFQMDVRPRFPTEVFCFCERSSLKLHQLLKVKRVIWELCLYVHPGRCLCCCCCSILNWSISRLSLGSGGSRGI